MPPEAGHESAARGGAYRPIRPKEAPYVLCRPTTVAAGRGGGRAGPARRPPHPPPPTARCRPGSDGGVYAQWAACQGARSACRGGGALTWPPLPATGRGRGDGRAGPKAASPSPPPHFSARPTRRLGPIAVPPSHFFPRPPPPARETRKGRPGAHRPSSSWAWPERCGWVGALLPTNCCGHVRRGGTGSEGGGRVPRPTPLNGLDGPSSVERSTAVSPQPRMDGPLGAWREAAPPSPGDGPFGPRAPPARANQPGRMGRPIVSEFQGRPPELTRGRRARAPRTTRATPPLVESSRSTRGDVGSGVSVCSAAGAQDPPAAVAWGGDGPRPEQGACSVSNLGIFLSTCRLCRGGRGQRLLPPQRGHPQAAMGRELTPACRGRDRPRRHVAVHKEKQGAGLVLMLGHVQPRLPCPARVGCLPMANVSSARGGGRLRGSRNCICWVAPSAAPLGGVVRRGPPVGKTGAACVEKLTWAVNDTPIHGTSYAIEKSWTASWPHNIPATKKHIKRAS